MARAARAKTQAPPEQGKDAWHQARTIVAYLMFAAVAATMLYGAWLALYMHFSKSMPQYLVLRYFACAVLSAALYTICARVEPLPARRKKRGKRWINIETPTTRQIWETAPGDFVESILSAVGMMAAPAMLFIGLGSFIDFEDLPDLIVATTVCAGAFAIEGAFVSWRGRSMFDPPGQVRVKRPEATTPHKESDAVEIGGDAVD